MTSKNPKVHAIPPKPKAPTEEELKQQQARFIMQQRGAVAQSALNSLVSGASFDWRENDPSEVVTYAVALADEYVKLVYGFALKTDEPKEDE
jgi:hypothetical protein